MKKWLFAVLLIICILASTFIVDSQNYVKTSNIIDYSLDYQGNLYILNLENDNENVKLMKFDPNGRKMFSKDLQSESNGSYFKYKQIEIDYSGNILILSNLMSDIEVERGEFEATIEHEVISRYRPNGEFVEYIVNADWSNHDKIIYNPYIVKFEVFEDFIGVICNDSGYWNLRKVSTDYNSGPVNETDFKLIDENGIEQSSNLSSDYSITITSNGKVLYATKTGQLYVVGKDGVSKNLTSRISDQVSIVQMSANNNNVCFLEQLSGIIYTYDTDLDEFSQIFKPDSCIDQANNIFVYDIYDIAFVNSDGQEIFSGRTKDGKSFIRFGSFSNTISKMKEPLNYKVVVNILLCTLVTFLPFVVVYVLITTLRRRFPLKAKILILFLPVFILSIAIVFNLLYNESSYDYRGLKLESQYAISKSFAYMVDGDKLKNISIKDYNSNEYLSLKKSYDEIFKLFNKGIDSSDFIKIYKVENNLIYTFLRYDNENNIYAELAYEDAIGTENSALLSRQNKNSGEADLYNILDQIQYNKEPNSVFAPGKNVYDRVLNVDNNEFVGTVSPIYDSNGTVVGLVENVILGDKYFNELNQMYFNSLIILLIEILILLIYFFFILKFSLKPLIVLQKSVSLVSVGVWNAKVKVKTNDELGDIGIAFNMMSDRIDKYISNIMLLNKVSVRFLPKDIFKLMGKERLTDVCLYDKIETRCNLILLNFKYRGESRGISDREDYFNNMNDNFNAIYQVVTANHGIVESCDEDGILLIFPEDSDNALNAAIQLKDMFVDKSESTYIKIVLGVDDVLIGIAGNDERYSVTVVSDTIMLSRYIDSHIDKVGVKYVIMQNMIGEITEKPNLNYRYIGKVKMMSKDGFTNIYELIDDKEVHEKNLYLSTKKLFEYGVRSYVNGDFYNARKAFSSVLSVNEDDKVAMYYLSLCNENENMEHYNWEGYLF